MSSWTYVTGVIEVDTFGRSDAEAMYMAQTVVNHLPRITVQRDVQNSIFLGQMVIVLHPMLTSFTKLVIFSMINIVAALLSSQRF